MTITFSLVKHIASNIPITATRTFSSYAWQRCNFAVKTGCTVNTNQCILRICSSSFNSGSRTMSSQVEKVCKPSCLFSPMEVPSRLLLGPGPSNASKRVLEAMSKPLLGHLHPEFLKIMDHCKEGLRYIFQTEECQNVFCISGTGHAGMESVMVNLLEPGDTILIAKNGIWGERAGNMATRQEANVRFLDKSPGEGFNLDEIEEGLRKYNPSVFFIVQVESSTGVHQPLEGIGQLCRKYGSLLVVDAVASLGGVPFYMDDWEVDLVYTGSQKVLSCPPSLAPIALNDRAMQKVLSRKSPPRSYYFDYKELANYWGCDDNPRRYHHTGPITSVYALREGLAHVAEEGLENLWSRHSKCASQLHEGLHKIGLSLFVANPKFRAPTINTIKLPEGVQWKEVTDHLMKSYHVEMSGGLGPTAGKVWRIGLLGENCKPSNVEYILKALGDTIADKTVTKNKL